MVTTPADVAGWKGKAAVPGDLASEQAALAMTSRPVATGGDVQATRGDSSYTGAESGTWTPVPISCEAYEHLTIGGAKVIHGASCTFNFSGISSSGATVAGTSTVTLTAATTILQGASSKVLVDGDSARIPTGIS